MNGVTNVHRGYNNSARMSKAHFEFLADFLADLPGIHRDYIAPILASKLARTNPKFNRDKFLTASLYQGPR